jgi:hypothetical protein
MVYSTALALARAGINNPTPATAAENPVCLAESFRHLPPGA